MHGPDSDQHYFTIRGRGFDLKQWSRITNVVQDLCQRATDAGVPCSVETTASCFVVTGPDDQAFAVWRQGEPNIPKEVGAVGQFDHVVMSILATMKKIAPDIIEMSNPDGRNYRRLFAKSNKPGEGAWTRMKRFDAKPETKEEAFLKAVSRKKWINPATYNKVEFISLPKTEQTRIHKRWLQEWGQEYERALAKAKKETEEAKREVEQAGKEIENLDDVKQEAEKAEDLDKAFQDTLSKMASWQERTPSVADAVTRDQVIRKAAIRVASTTEDVELKAKILEILRPTVKSATEDEDVDEDREAGFKKDEDVDVADFLREKGNEEAAEKWEKNKGNFGKNAATALVFPGVQDLAWKQVVAFYKKNPDSGLSKSSTRVRVAAATRLAKDWIEDAVKRPGRVREYLNVPEGEKIPMGKLDAAIKKLEGTDNKSLLSALLLAKRLKKMSADDS